MGYTRLEGSLFIHVLQLFSLVDRFTAWRATERFFTKFFCFLFNNTTWNYLCWFGCVFQTLLFLFIF